MVYLVKVDRVSTNAVVEEPESELMAKLKKRCGCISSPFDVETRFFPQVLDSMNTLIYT